MLLQTTYTVRPPGGGGVLAVYMTGDLTELHFATPPPKKKHKPEILHPPKIPGIKISYPKKYSLNTSTLIYSIRQTLTKDLKKYATDLLTQKKYQGCKFWTQKNTEGVNFQPKKYVGNPQQY